MANLFKYDFGKQEQFNILVGKLEIKGLKRTQKWFIDRYFKEVAKSTNLLELNNSLVESLSKVHQLDLIEKVLVELDLDERGRTLVDLHMTEKSALAAKFGVSATTNNEVEIYVNGIYRSLFGVGDKTSVSCSYYGGDNFGVNTNFEVKDLILPKWSIGGDVFSKRKIIDTELTQIISGGNIAGEILQNHVVGYGLHKREIEGIEKEVDLAGDLRKRSRLSQFSHTYRKFLAKNPDHGCFFRIENNLNEGFVFGGDWFLKTQIYTSMYKKVFNSLMASVDLNLGSVMSRGKFVELPDRVHSKVRGYKIPSRRGLYCFSVLASMGIPLSLLGRYLDRKANMEFMGTRPHFHAFANIGSNFMKFERAKKHVYMSVGLGIYFSLSVGRIEFNYCFPMTKFNDKNFNKFDVSFVLS